MNMLLLQLYCQQSPSGKYVLTLCLALMRLQPFSIFDIGLRVVFAVLHFSRCLFGPGIDLILLILDICRYQVQSDRVPE